MATGQLTGNQDFLSREVFESNSDESIKSELLSDLAKAEEIKKKFGNNPEVIKEYDDLRIATIGALKDLRISTSSDLDAIRISLTGDFNFPKLGENGDITNLEYTNIKKEFNDIETKEKEIELENLLGELSMDYEKYGDSIGILSLLFNNLGKIDISLISRIKKDINSIGKINGKTYQILVQSILNKSEISIIETNSVKSFLRKDLNGEYNGDFNTDFQLLGITDTSAYIKGLHEFSNEDIRNTEYILFNFPNKIQSCFAEINIALESIRYQYLESKNISVQKNISNFFLNQTIPENKQVKYTEIIKKLEVSGKLNELGDNLKQGGCNIDRVSILKTFTEMHFSELGITFSYSEEDIKLLLGSVIDLKRAENKLEGQEAQERATEETGKTPSQKEIDEALAAKDQEKALMELYGVQNITPGIKEIIENYKDSQKIDTQEARMGVVAKNAGSIAKMTDKEIEQLKEAARSNYDSPDEFKKLLEEEIEEIKDTRKQNTNSASNTTSSSGENASTIPISERISAGEAGTHILTTSSGTIPITQNDKNVLERNPEAEKGFIDFYNTLEELHLLNPFWKEKDTIFTAITNTNVSSGLNLDDKTYIDGSDMALFLYTILDSISDHSEIVEAGEKKRIENAYGQKQNLEIIKNLMIDINKQRTGEEQSESSILRGGEGRVGRIFRELFQTQKDDEGKDEESLTFHWEKFHASLSH